MKTGGKAVEKEWVGSRFAGSNAATGAGPDTAPDP